MRVAEALGSVAAIFFAIVLFYALAGNPPAYRYWGESLDRLIPPDFVALSREISGYIWGSLFPLFIAFGLVLLTLALGLTALLRREE